MSATSITRAIPAEFLGLARDLRNNLAADDVVAYREMNRLCVPFASIRNGTIPRPAMLARTATAWQAKVPTTGRLRLEIDLKPKSLFIRELRALAADTSFSDWAPGASEPGIGLAAISLEVNPPRFRYDPVKLGGISQHALSRWFQRSFVNTRSALMQDLTTLAMAATDELLGQHGEFEVPAGDGRWVGLVMAIEDQGLPQRVLAARSFLSE